jgi:hypothetical protein
VQDACPKIIARLYLNPGDGDHVVGANDLLNENGLARLGRTRDGNDDIGGANGAAELSLQPFAVSADIGMGRELVRGEDVGREKLHGATSSRRQ